MTRKDYIVIASALRESQASDGVIAAISSALKEDNPKFDTIHFVDVVTGKREPNSKPCRKVTVL